MNFTLIIFALLIFILASKGYRVGLTREISGLVAWMVTLFVIALMIVIYNGFRQEEAAGAVASIALLIVVGLVYGAVRLFFKSIGALSKLPVFHFLDSILGFVIGAGEGILIIWLLYILNAGGVLGRLGEMITADTMESQILMMLYEYNYLLRFILSASAI